ncbi:Uncharacterized protein TPAR_03752 [Tolypocladium paradoxum]|uniref:Uncharacterized protein n=1 Tax=Tolypocladium paradoxum TaxID=94208 RepID=A0A2S4L0S9_9HYPO|nr:Uncharacterized protein TPAR_03752 [Tolypocladium paradoxum]
MRLLSVIGLLALLPSTLSEPDSPPDYIVRVCKQNGQVPQKVDGRWKCVGTLDICDPDQDQSTVHQDPKTGNWICCPKGQVLQKGSCVTPVPPPVPGTCEARLKDAGFEDMLRATLEQCFPCDQAALDEFVKYYMSVLNGGLNLVETINKNGCGKPTPSPGPSHDWWRCPKDKNSPCKWLPLENNKTPKTLLATGSGRTVLPNPNIPRPNYKYPFDTWVTAWPDDDLEIYVQGQNPHPQASGTSFLIPAGTLANDVYYRAPKGTQIQFYGACSADTPCIGEEVRTWTEGPHVTTSNRDGEIDVSGYDSDLVFTITDTWVTTEQYTVLADGKEVGKTHGRLTLGADKYNTNHIAKTTDVGATLPSAALLAIANDGFWGSFRIPRGTKKVTVRLSFEAVPYPFYVFAYRVDKLCKC